MDFDAACVYTWDPTKRTLEPVLKMGNLPVHRLMTVKQSDSIRGGDLVAAAFSCKTPLKEEQYTLDDSLSTSIAGLIGDEELPIGVLYLESHSVRAVDENQNQIAIFQALRHCLKDCLYLR